MMLVYSVVFGTIVLLGITVVLAFVWAIGNGQLQNFQRGATSIFDPDEPVGVPTDAFPGVRNRVSAAISSKTGAENNLAEETPRDV